MSTKPRLRASSHSRESSGIVLDIPHIDLGKPRKRWRSAYFVISFTRALRSLAQKIAVKNTDTVLNISPHADNHALLDPHPSSNNDQTRLKTTAREKNLDHLHQLGGVKGIVDAIGSDFNRGVRADVEDLKRRREAFGSNTYHKPPPKGFLHFVIEALKDATIIILLVCAILSLAFGIKEYGLDDGWYNGGSIFLAVSLVVVVSAITNFRQSRQFEELSKVSNNIQVSVVRDGKPQDISIFDVVVGDVVRLKIGDVVPADGLFLSGHSLQLDESSMTGESDYVEIDDKKNPFLLSGAKVADGYAQMVVTSVGMNTGWGEMMSSISGSSNEKTPLQARLDKLTSAIGKVGLIVAGLVLVVLLIRYFTGTSKDAQGNREFIAKRTKTEDVFNAMVRIVSDAVTIVVVAIPEGLPLAVTLTLAYSMKRMMRDQAMVRKLSACETMGSATVICTDKTGTLTMNLMTVTNFWLGKDDPTSNAPNKPGPIITELLHQGVGFNTTASIYKASPVSQPEFSGSPTEKAILSWAVKELEMDFDKLKPKYKILHVETFNSVKKRSGVLIRNETDNTHHVHWKGAAEIVLAMCSKCYDKSGNGQPMGEGERKEILHIIEGMAANALRCIAFAHKKITLAVAHEEIPSAEIDKIMNGDDFIFLGVVGLKDPCRPGVKEAVNTCKNAKVEVKMITGDNIFTARAIAIECGILDQNTDDVEVVEGVQFRSYTPDVRKEKVNKIKVMARSSPFDKLLMVKCLKEGGHVVGVTGDGTNDAPALKEADVGLSMGIQGTEVAKESSDIVILDDNFTSVVTVLKWGRCVYNSIQKFIQFQLTVNVAALVINLVAACTAGDVPLTAVQLLWVNLIMDTLGALALATERPTNELMEKPPVGRTEPLITNVMWRNLMFQAMYQVIILLALQFKGKSVFNVSTEVRNTMIFNTFVLCQVFNEFNARKLEKKNVFKGILENRLFLYIIMITVVLQVVMVEFLKKFADTERLNWLQWAVCIGLAAVSWPLGWLVKCIAVRDKPYLSYIKWKRIRNPSL